MLWFVWPRVVLLERYLLFLASGETGVFLVEAAVICGITLSWQRTGASVALLASLCANCASCAAGLFLQALRA